MLTRLQTALNRNNAEPYIKAVRHLEGRIVILGPEPETLFYH
jgi:hypothetical protein